MRPWLEATRQHDERFQRLGEELKAERERALKRHDDAIASSVTRSYATTIKGIVPLSALSLANEFTSSLNLTAATRQIIGNIAPAIKPDDFPRAFSETIRKSSDALRLLASEAFGRHVKMDAAMTSFKTPLLSNSLTAMELFIVSELRASSNNARSDEAGPQIAAIAEQVGSALKQVTANPNDSAAALLASVQQAPANQRSAVAVVLLAVLYWLLNAVGQGEVQFYSGEAFRPMRQFVVRRFQAALAGATHTSSGGAHPAHNNVYVVTADTFECIRDVPTPELSEHLHFLILSPSARGEEPGLRLIILTRMFR